MQRCIGRTKKFQRCRRKPRWLFCHQHRYQPWFVVVGIVGSVATLGGIYRDVLEPLFPSVIASSAKPEAQSVALDTTMEFVDLLGEFIPAVGEQPSWDFGTGQHLPIVWIDASGFYSERSGVVALTANGVPVYESFVQGQLITGQWSVTYGSHGSMNIPDGDLFGYAEAEHTQDPPTARLRQAIDPFIEMAMDDTAGTAQFSFVKIRLPGREPCFLLLQYAGMRSWSATFSLLWWTDEEAEPLVRLFRKYLDLRERDPSTDELITLESVLVGLDPYELREWERNVKSGN